MVKVRPRPSPEGADKNHVDMRYVCANLLGKCEWELLERK
jgi:hypothetical protein